MPPEHICHIHYSCPEIRTYTFSPKPHTRVVEVVSSMLCVCVCIVLLLCGHTAKIEHANVTLCGRSVHNLNACCAERTNKSGCSSCIHTLDILYKLKKFRLSFPKRVLSERDILLTAVGHQQKYIVDIFMVFEG